MAIYKPTKRTRALSLTSLMIMLTVSACSPGADRADEASKLPFQTAQEFNTLYQACMAESGWEMSLGADEESVIYDQPTEAQAPLFNADRDACLDSLGQLNPAPPSQETVLRIYEAQVASAECLREQGASIGDTPSFQEYTETFSSDQWSPYLSLSADEYVKLAQVCPELEPVFE